MYFIRVHCSSIFSMTWAQPVRAGVANGGASSQLVTLSALFAKVLSRCVLSAFSIIECVVSVGCLSATDTQRLPQGVGVKG